MQLDEAGEWWLPARPDHRCPGILTFSAAEGTKLRLLRALLAPVDEGEPTTQGAFTRITMTEARLDDSGVYGRIHGQVRHEAYTLDNAIRIRRTGDFFGEQSEEIIVADRVLRGAWFEENERLAATSLSIGLVGHDEWIGSNGLSERFEINEQAENPGSRIVAVGGEQLPERGIATDNGLSVALVHHVGVAGDGVTTRSVVQRFSWRVGSPKVMPLEDLLDVASDLQDIVSIATTRPAPFASVTLRHPDVAERLDDGGVIERPIEVLANWTVRARESGRRPQPDEMLFTFTDVGGLDGIAEWLRTAARHRGPLRRVMATRYSESMLVSDRVLNCAAAIEAFDRLSHPKKNEFLQRFRRCVKVAGDPFARLVGDTESWIAIVKQERNDIAHHGGLRTRNPSAALYYLSQSLYYLFVLCLLRDMDAPPAAIDHVGLSREFRHLQRQLPAALASLAASH